MQKQSLLHRMNPDKYKAPSGPIINSGTTEPNAEDEMELAKHLYEKIQLDDIQRAYKVDRATAKKMNERMMRDNVEVAHLPGVDRTKFVVPSIRPRKQQQ